MFFWIVSGVLLAAVDIFCGRGHIKIEGSLNKQVERMGVSF